MKESFQDTIILAAEDDSELLPVLTQDDEAQRNKEIFPDQLFPLINLPVRYFPDLSYAFISYLASAFLIHDARSTLKFISLAAFPVFMIIKSIL